MPPQSFRQLTSAQFADLLRRYPFTRKIDAVHMHHTWRPTKADYAGLETIVGMWRYHTQVNGWSDIAQHLTIAPDGTVWTGRNWNLPPASARGYNGNRASGPFMFEIIGNFDAGHERLEGEQRETVLEVIAAIQERFGLPPESLRFHNAMTDQKSCPGTSVEYANFLAELEDFRGRRPSVLAARQPGAAEGAARAFGDDQLEGRTEVDEAMRLMLAGSDGARASDGPDGEPDEEEMDVGRARALADEDGGAARAGSASGLDAEDLAELAAHVINLNQGVPSTGGFFQSDEFAIRAIFEEHIPRWRERQGGDGPLRILFFAHGGLVQEEAGLVVAKKQVDFWLSNGVYPVFFVWETGLAETLGQILARAARRVIPFGARGPLDWIIDRTTDPLIANFCHRFGGVGVWGSMKYAAEQASRPGGGAYLAAEVLDEALAGITHDGTQVELHAVGHSAGSILLSHFIAMIAARKQGGGLQRLPGFATVHFLAPAIRVDTFKQTLWPLVGEEREVKWLTVFTMRDALEREDDCVVYRKSLLYLIHDGLEPRKGTEILGLERSLRRDADLRPLHLSERQLGAHAPKRGDVVWSKTTAAQADGRSASTSKEHGAFDDDPPTMDSVARRVLGIGGDVPLAYPFRKARQRHKSLVETVGGVLTAPFGFLGDLLKTREMDVPFGAPRIAVPAPAAGRWNVRMDEEEFPDESSRAVRGRRRALCIGIDAYRRQPLAGCVNDARLWQETFRAMGFQVELLTNERATRAAILHALERMISSARRGDVLALQFSGHGTTVPDTSGDETGGYNGRRDEALCPVDLHTGALLVDDDIADVFRRLPAGVNLTCFIDCCHSGTITRFAVGDPLATEAGGGRRARYLVATPDLIEAHREFRRRHGASRSVTRDAAAMREVVFSACRDDEVAWEEQGQGEFTRRAVAVLRSGARLSNRQFRDRVVAAFGAQPKQHPVLDAAPGALDRPLLGPLSRAEPEGQAVEHVAEEAEAGITVPAGMDAETVAQLLEAMAAVLRGGR